MERKYASLCRVNFCRKLNYVHYVVNGNYRDGLQDEDNDEGVMYRLRKRRSKTSRTSLSVQEAPEAGYPLFSDESESEDSQAIQNSQTDESIRDAEVEENVIDFENSSLGNREEVEEKEEDTKESVFLAAPIRDLNVNLENIKKSLMLSGEEETKSLKVIEDGIKGLSIEGMSMRVKKSVEEGDGNNNAISNCSGVDVNAELGGIKIQCLKKLDFFQDEMKSNDEIKEQLSSPI